MGKGMKNKNYIFMKILFFKKDVVIDGTLVSNQISFGEKNYKYFIGCLYGDYEIKPLHIELPKISTYIKR